MPKCPVHSTTSGCRCWWRPAATITWGRDAESLKRVTHFSCLAGQILVALSSPSTLKGIALKAPPNPQPTTGYASSGDQESSYPRWQNGGPAWARRGRAGLLKVAGSPRAKRDCIRNSGTFPGGFPCQFLATTQLHHPFCLAKQIECEKQLAQAHTSQITTLAQRSCQLLLEQSSVIGFTTCPTRHAKII